MNIENGLFSCGDLVECRINQIKGFISSINKVKDSDMISYSIFNKNKNLRVKTIESDIFLIESKEERHSKLIKKAKEIREKQEEIKKTEKLNNQQKEPIFWDV